MVKHQKPCVLGILAFGSSNIDSQALSRQMGWPLAAAILIVKHFLDKLFAPHHIHAVQEERGD